MDSTTFGGDVPELSRWTGPPRTVVVALVFLYLSLAASVTSVLFTTLAKQLLHLYALAGPSGSNTENGQSQQPKSKWLTVALQTVVFLLYLLLQFALFLLACALVVYIWEINLVVASLVLALTLCAAPVCFLFYLSILIRTHSLLCRKNA